MPRQHRSPLKRQGEGDHPRHQAGRRSGAQPHHRRALAMGPILIHLVEMGAKQHQGGGQGRATAQLDGLAPRDLGPSRLVPADGRRGEGEQSRRRGEGPKGQPTQGLPQPPIPQAKRGALVEITQAATGQNQRQHRRGTAPGHQGHQSQAQHQTTIGPSRDPVAATREVDHRVGLAEHINARIGIKNIVGQVFPGQQQDRRQQKNQQLIPAQRLVPRQLPARRHQHWHHRHGVHRPLDRGLPELAAISVGGVTACDDLELRHGCRQRQGGEDPYI